MFFFQAAIPITIKLNHWVATLYHSNISDILLTTQGCIVLVQYWPRLDIIRWKCLRVKVKFLTALFGLTQFTRLITLFTNLHRYKIFLMSLAFISHWQGSHWGFGRDLGMMAWLVYQPWAFRFWPELACFWVQIDCST